MVCSPFLIVGFQLYSATGRDITALHATLGNLD